MGNSTALNVPETFTDTIELGENHAHTHTDPNIYVKPVCEFLLLLFSFHSATKCFSCVFVYVARRKKT